MKYKIKFHWSFFLLCVLMIVFGKFQMFLCAMIVVLCHEFGHAFVGRKLGYKLDLITLLPYGAMLSGKTTPFSQNDEIKIAIAGPLVNAFFIVINYVLWWVFPNIFSVNNYFFYSNLYTFLFNMLPVYPLDGGRIFIALLSKKIPRIRAEKYTKILGYVITIFFFCLFFVSFIYELNYMLGINALFMLIGLLEEDTAPYYEKIYVLNEHFENADMNKVEYIASKDSIFSAYKIFEKDNLKNLYVIKNGKVIKKIKRSEVMSKILKLPINTPIEKI